VTSDLRSLTHEIRSILNHFVSRQSMMWNCPSAHSWYNCPVQLCASPAVYIYSSRGLRCPAARSLERVAPRSTQASACRSARFRRREMFLACMQSSNQTDRNTFRQRCPVCLVPSVDNAMQPPQPPNSRSVHPFPCYVDSQKHKGQALTSGSAVGACCARDSTL